MSSRDEQARAAGHSILYGSMSESNSAPYNGGITSTDHAVQNGMTGEGDLESMVRRQPISAIRRTFCLVVLFDLIISVILWLIFTEVKSGEHDSSDAFEHEVSGYTFQTSLFDTVMLSAFRFVVLELAYALFQSKRPWFVAGTTVVSCIVMICKVVFYGHVSDATPPPTELQIIYIIIILASIVMSWVETWLLDLRVLPHEKKELERLREAATRAENEHGYSERSPLLSRFLRPARTEESYYSPVHSDSDQDSDGEDSKSFHSAIASRSHSRSHSLTSSTSQGTHYKSMIIAAQRSGLEYLECTDWFREAGTDEVKGIVYAKHVKPWGKIFKLVAELNADALTLYNDLVENASGMPKWNPTVLEVKTLESVDDNTEISYNVAAEGAAGMVSSRDFVCIRHWEQFDGWYVTSSVSVEHSSMPPQSKYVRGEQGPNIMRLKDIEGNKLRFEFLLITNLKGWLPQYLIDQALSGVLMDYLANLKKFSATFSPNGASQ